MPAMTDESVPAPPPETAPQYVIEPEGTALVRLNNRGQAALDLAAVTARYGPQYYSDPQTGKLWTYDGLCYVTATSETVRNRIWRDASREGLPYLSATDRNYINGMLSDCHLTSELKRPSPYTAVFSDGVLDLGTMELVPHGDPRVLCTSRLSVPWSAVSSWKDLPEPSCAAYPYLRELFSDDPDALEVLFECFGCFLFDKKRRYSPLLYIYGTGGSGKSHLCSLICGVLGNRGWVGHLPNSEHSKFNLAYAYRDLFLVDEVKDGELSPYALNELKALTSAVPYEVTPKGKESFQIAPEDKPMIVMTSNDRPSFQRDSGLDRRFHILRTADVQITDAVYQYWRTEDFRSWLVWQSLQAYRRVMARGSIADNTITDAILSSSENSVLAMWLETQGCGTREEGKTWLMSHGSDYPFAALRDTLKDYETGVLRHDRLTVKTSTINADLDRLYGLRWYKQRHIYQNVYQRGESNDRE